MPDSSRFPRRLFGLAFSLLLSFPAPADVKLICPAGYLPNVPFLVRVEERSPGFEPDRSRWNVEATLTVDTPGITLSTNRLLLRNGLGTALLKIDGDADFNLIASFGDRSVTNRVRTRASEPVLVAGGTLSEVNTFWNGLVHVTADLVVPDGHTLTIASDTLVLVEGSASGTSGVAWTVRGTIESLGTETAPVVITSSGFDLNWGQIRHDHSQPSRYEHTFISKAGRAPGEGHTGTGPALRVEGSELLLESCVVSDLTSAGGGTIGKIMMASDSALTLRNSVFTRARMGPEIEGTSLLCLDSFFLDMSGPDDADGIYLHSAAGRPMALARCVLAGGTDDAVDTYNADVTLDDCILRDWPNPNEDAKGISVFHGEVTLRRCLIVNCLVGAAAKSSGPPAVLRIDHCTITGIERGVSAATKSNAGAGNIEIDVSNSIVRAPDALHSDFGPEKFKEVVYSNLSEPWPGTGNFTADPVFASAPDGDYRLSLGSPAIDAGDPTFAPDPDGSRSDAGYRPFSGGATSAIVIHEIMYHPGSENPREEFIELFNRGAVPINVNGWRLDGAVEFTFPDVEIPARGFLVVAADLAVFQSLYPNVQNLLGNWMGVLSNSREEIRLLDSQGRGVNQVRYADEGEWAVRQRGLPHRGYRGWTWFAEHDGLGKSLELIQPDMPNGHGQNWGSSSVAGGTPGAANSVRLPDVAPFIQEVRHTPAVPTSSDSVVVTARVADDRDLQVAIALHYRIDAVPPGPFVEVEMRDDGRSGDLSANDGIFSASIPPQPNNAVVEFYLSATDQSGLTRTWPAPAIAAVDGAGPSGQIANALFQIDDAPFAGPHSLYKIILTESERAELAAIQNNVAGSSGSDAQMNATFIAVNSNGVGVRYLAAVRNRGHGSRARKPNNFRVVFRSDGEWQRATALNLNGQFTWLQILGAAQHLKSGLVGAHAQPVQLRVNNSNPALTGGTDRTYGLYAANEAIDADWADRHFPDDGEGNVYRAIRDLVPSNFDYRTIEAYPQLRGAEHRDSYTNTWFKTTNRSEDDWTDLIGMLRVLGPNGTEAFTTENVSRVINVRQWLRHLAAMNLLGNAESGLNSGFNDDYFMYRGVNDPRFILMYYDLDQIFGYNGGYGPTGSLFTATNSSATQGAGLALQRLLRHPEFEARYFAELGDLIQTTFAQDQFAATVDHSLGGFVPETVRNQIKAWMNARRNYVLSQLPAQTPAFAPAIALTGVPRSPTPHRFAQIVVSGEGITYYRFSLNGSAPSEPAPVSAPILLTVLGEGEYTLTVTGEGESAVVAPAALTVSWVLDTSAPSIRLNEFIASRSGGLPDAIELFNDGSSPVELAGLRITDDPSRPGKFTFPPGALALPSGGFITIDSTQLGFALDKSGESIHLFDAVEGGGALLDSVEFGLQVADLSVGRIGAGREWFLTQPTFGAANTPQRLGNARDVVINEWLAAGASPFPNDFIELFNPNSLPVGIGGFHLTDRPAGAPRRQRIRDLTFLPAQGHGVFTSDSGNGPSSLNFSIESDRGELALFTPDGSVADIVLYNSQERGVSEGRCPDGGLTQRSLLLPTPGSFNECPAMPLPPQFVPLLAWTNHWSFEASGADPGTGWMAPDFDDSHWASGPGVLGFSGNPLPEPISTLITESRDNSTYYFRTRFVVDEALVSTAVELTHLIDDGAAFYLNGSEIGTRHNLAPGALHGSFAASTIGIASFQSLILPPNLLLPGINVLAVEVHQGNRGSGDLVFGLRLQARIPALDPAANAVVLNEALANNRTLQNGDGAYADWVELFNPSLEAVDLTGFSLSDTVTTPARWRFPTGTVISGRAFLSVLCDGNLPPSASNTGFGLAASGGSIHLFHPDARPLSSIAYGLQAAGWSIGRVPDGGTNWMLTVPTSGTSNRAAMLGSSRSLRINEWLANPATGEDWFELFNPGTEPIELSGLWLSDEIAMVMKSPIPNLSFLGTGSGAFQRFEADERTDLGADHVRFKLNAEGESLLVATPHGAILDGLSFGPQTVNVSVGRFPDGAPEFVSFDAPSPGAANLRTTPLDLDGDGLPDQWELDHSLSPSDPSDARADLDRDGLTALEEFRAGTDPRDATSSLDAALRPDAAGNYFLEFQLAAGRQYRIEVRESLGHGEWTTLFDYPPENAPRLAQVPVPMTASGARFFRIAVTGW